VRCLLIEDEAETASYISAGLCAAGFSATVCATGAASLRCIADARWDIIILDRMLPGSLDGLSLLTCFRQLGVTIPVLILSALASPNECVRGLRAGGDDYLTKPFVLPELIARLHVLMRRSGAPLDEPEVSIADLHIDLWGRTVSRAGTVIPLKPHEFRLLVYLAQHKGKIVTRRMLARSVWGVQTAARDSVVDAHISRLRQKIDDGFSPPLLHTLRGIGYTMDADG
jgi:two-component system, OmpR family, response regulator